MDFDVSFDLAEPDNKTMHGLFVAGDSSYLVSYDDPERADEIGELLDRPVRHAKMKKHPTHHTISVVVLKNHRKGNVR
jgi:hypothetical protein